MISIKQSVDLFHEFLSAFQESDTFNQLLEEESNHDAHEDGCFGLTHAQTIGGWGDFLRNEYSARSEAEYKAIAKEIQECWDWHKENGTLDEET